VGLEAWDFFSGEVQMAGKMVALENKQKYVKS
jgi:hypothetical protein